VRLLLERLLSPANPLLPLFPVLPGDSKLETMYSRKARGEHSSGLRSFALMPHT
jgi:hypothetical protein